jgi:hypothetical protein
MKHNQTIKTMAIFAKKTVAKHGTRLRDRRETELVGDASQTELAGDASQTPYIPNGTKG